METPKEFSARAWRLYRQAQRLSERLTENDAAFIQWMCVSSSRGMNWIEGVEFLNRENDQRVGEGRPRHIQPFSLISIPNPRARLPIDPQVPGYELLRHAGD
jgi:hypothetical protein